MACLYNKDTEIYENYILNRLSDEEKSEFEGHLNSCKICQDRLEKEKWLQANLREIGKREMKTEIRKQVEMRHAGRNLTDWGMIMRVAAVILFVVITPGVIYYYQYLTPLMDDHMAAKFSDAKTEEILAPQAGSDQAEDIAKEQAMPKSLTMEDVKEIGQEGKAAAIARKKETERAQVEEIPAEIYNLVGKGKLEESGASKESPSFKVLSREAQIAGEIEKNAGRREPLAAMADDEAVFRYDEDQSTVNGYNETSAYYESNRLSESKLNQKSWLFRKSNSEITIRLQLLDEKRDKDQELPQKMPAQIFVQDSLRMTIDCQVTPAFYELNPDSVTLYQPNPQTLQIQLPRQMMYEIDLTQKSQEAVQIRR